jgi:peroxiredoxin
VVAVVAQRSAVVRRYVEDSGLPFYVLVDETREVTKQYGVWHRLGLDAWNIARPALFVIEPTGKIRAIFVGESQEEFPNRDEIDTALTGIEAG